MRNPQFLQKLHDNLTRKLSPPKAIDPFTILPVELVELVLAYLPFKNIVNMLRVSKGWKNYITRRPKLWQVLDLSEASKPVSRSFVNKAVNYAEKDVTKLVIHRFQHTDMLRRIATACKGLREVEVLSLPIMLSETFVEMAQCAYGLKKVIVRTDITLDTVMQVLRHRPSLEHVEFHSVLCKNSRPNPNWKGPFPNLHTIALAAIADQNLHRLPGESITNLCPNLRNLSLAGWADMVSTFPSCVLQHWLRHHQTETVPMLTNHCLPHAGYDKPSPTLSVSHTPSLPDKSRAKAHAYSSVSSSPFYIATPRPPPEQTLETPLRRFHHHHPLSMAPHHRFSRPAPHPPRPARNGRP